jgi:hypothetical protein
VGCPLASEEADSIHSIHDQRDKVCDEQQEEPVGKAWFVRDRVKTGGHPSEHWNPQEMSRTQDAGETHTLIEERLTCDSHCGHRQNDLRLDMRDEEKTGGVNAYEPYAPQARNGSEPEVDYPKKFQHLHQKAHQLISIVFRLIQPCSVR